ncbi:hypothetical protein WH47_03736, partial [Habropoda laboriosa]
REPISDPSKPSCTLQPAATPANIGRLSVLIGHGVPPGYPSSGGGSSLSEKQLVVIRKPLASIYLWSWIARVYVEPPLHTTIMLIAASVAHRMNLCLRLIPIPFVLERSILWIELEMLAPNYELYDVIKSGVTSDRCRIFSAIFTRFSMGVVVDLRRLQSG